MDWVGEGALVEPLEDGHIWQEGDRGTYAIADNRGMLLMLNLIVQAYTADMKAAGSVGGIIVIREGGEVKLHGVVFKGS